MPLSAAAIFMDVDCGTDACLAFDPKIFAWKGFVLNLQIVVSLSSSEQSSRLSWSCVLCLGMTRGPLLEFCVVSGHDSGW